jgi:hypothetical protein
LAGLQHISNGAVSFLKAPLALPTGNAETIANSLAPFHKPRDRDAVVTAAQTGFLQGYENCGGSINGPGVGSQIEQLGIVTGVKAGLAAIPVVGGALSGLAGLVTAPFAHHKQAVKTEQATLCRAVPEANNFLRGIDAALAQGQIDAATAVQLMEQGYQNWLPEIRGIIKEGGNTCNAACIERKEFRAAIEKRKQDYAIVAAQSASASQNILHGVSNAVRGVADALGFGSGGGSGSPSGSALVQAGLTPARQNTLAMSIMVGGLLVVGVLWFEFIRRAEK